MSEQYYLYSLLLITANTAALDNGVALTPPMGFNSYMSSALQNEQGLRKAAEFIVNSGMRDLGNKCINTDEGWEESSRDSQGNLQWNSTLYPSGLPTFIEFLHRNMLLLFGIYGASTELLRVFPVARNLGSCILRCMMRRSMPHGA